MAGFIEYTVDVSDLEKLAEAFPVLERTIVEEMEKAMTESGMVLTTMVAARTPVNYGLLRASISWPTGFDLQGSAIDTLRGIIGAGSAVSASGTSTMDYVDYVEWGTGPHWAPIAPLKLWALRKFGDERIAYRVRAAIAKHGTKGAHMFLRAWWEGGEDKVKQIWDAMLTRVLAPFERAAQ
jgi:hypothetical protein